MNKKYNPRILIDGIKGTLFLKRGQVTYQVLFDIEDVNLIKSFKWKVNKAGYVYCSYGLLHRLLMGSPEGKHIHHKNLNKLDNRKQNLQVLPPKKHLRIHGLIKSSNCENFKKQQQDKNINHWFNNLDPILKKNIQNLIRGNQHTSD